MMSSGHHKIMKNSDSQRNLEDTVCISVVSIVSADDLAPF